MYTASGLLAAVAAKNVTITIAFGPSSPPPGKDGIIELVLDSQLSIDYPLSINTEGGMRVALTRDPKKCLSQQLCRVIHAKPSPTPIFVDGRQVATAITLKGLEVTGGKALLEFGGGILIESNVVLTAEDCDFRNNTALFGGGIANLGVAILNNVSVHDNRARYGAGVYNGQDLFPNASSVHALIHAAEYGESGSGLYDNATLEGESGSGSFDNATLHGESGSGNYEGSGSFEDQASGDAQQGRRLQSANLAVNSGDTSWQMLTLNGTSIFNNVADALQSVEHIDRSTVRNVLDTSVLQSIIGHAGAIGGGLFSWRGYLTLFNGATLAGNSIINSDEVGDGDQFWLTRAGSYVLPLPIATYIPSNILPVFTCRETLSSDVESFIRECDYALFGGRKLATMPLFSDQDFPYLCASGYYGNSTDPEDQGRQSCSGFCPRGHYCPGPQCHEPIPCPAGTYSPSTALSAEHDCLECPAGCAPPRPEPLLACRPLLAPPHPNTTPRFFCFTPLLVCFAQTTVPKERSSHSPAQPGE